MKKVILLSLFFYTMSNLGAQSIERINVSFKKFGDELKYGLAGGLNTPQFSEVDLNNDGVQDMYIFERTGDVSLTFINNGTANEPDYEYAPEYQNDFPELTDWVLLRDYNDDGAMDIFAYSDVPGVEGVIVYTGYYIDDHLDFERFNFATPEFNFNLIPYNASGGNTNLYVSFVDYPAIDDIDGDGDLDILTFALGGGHVYLYNNISVELGHGKDSLIYTLEDVCWGRFYESGISEIIDLSPGVDSCVFGFVGETADDRHAGSTLLTFDNDNDNDKELILGDLSFNNLNMLTNGGNNEFAFMVDQDTFSPKNTLPADIPIFPASFLMDVDNDGKKDLLASPNSNQTGEDYDAVWFYKNTNSNEFPVFQYVQKDFLVEHMVDLGTDAHPAFLDYNADGLLDLVVGNSSFFQPFGEKAPRIYLFENTGTANSPKFNLIDDDYLEFSQYDGTNNYAPSPTFGDLDNDGDLDALIGEKSGGFFYAENTAGAGNPVSFGSLQIEYMGLDLGQNTVPQIVDLDRDGLPDIISGERVGKVSYFHNEGTLNEPLFIPNIDSQTPAGENIIVLGLIDTRFGNFTGRAAPVILDFDGEYHIFTGSEAGYLMQYTNIDGNITGEFDLVTDFYGEIREGFNTRPAIADIDNDGILEMVVGNERGGLSLFETNFNTDGTPVSTHYIYTQPEVKIFPNPANEFFNVELKNGKGTYVNISVFNAVGQEVFKDFFATSSYKVNCKGLSNGIYFTRIETGGEVVVKKVVLGK
jgi:hypothetical protein